MFSMDIKLFISLLKFTIELGCQEEEQFGRTMQGWERISISKETQKFSLLQLSNAFHRVGHGHICSGSLVLDCDL